MDKKNVIHSTVVMLAGGDSSINSISQAKIFLEQNNFLCTVIDWDDANDIWSLRKKLLCGDHILLFISEDLPQCLLHQLKSTPEHLLSIFPIQADNSPIPDSVSHRQTFNLKSDTNWAELQSALLDWLNEDARIFQQEQTRINQILHPLSFDQRLEDLKNIPRPNELEDIVGKIEKWDTSGRARFFAIVGKAGSGKSHLAARLLLEQGDRAAAAHFINKNDTPEQIIKNLAAQLAADIAQFRQALDNEIQKDIDSLDASSLFNELILSPLRRENPNRSYWLLLDGLEVLNDNYRQNPLVEILAMNKDQLPNWLKVIVTYRPDPNIQLLIGNLSETYTLPKLSVQQESYRFNDILIVPENVQSGPKTLSPAELEATSERLSIFISYGHDIHTGKVLEIREELVKCGHNVWIDRQGIPMGSDWRRKIYDGIRHSQLFLAFLSEHSVKSEYCQTEIRIAIGAPEHLLPSLPIQLEDANVPPQLSHLKKIDLCNWPSVDDRIAFASVMKDLVEWIDDSRHLKFCQEMAELNRQLEPFSFEARLGELLNSPFVGREWLLKIIDNWDKGSSRLFGIVGGPGFGKSIFAANLRALQPEKVVAAQFIEWNMPSLFTARRIICSLAFQLAVRMDEYRKILLDILDGINGLDALEENELFEKLLTQPLQNISLSGTRWIILDALDEAKDRDGHNPFVYTLVRNLEQLPNWLKIIVTTRPDSTILNMLDHYHLERFDTKVISAYQREDMLEFIYQELKVLVPQTDGSAPNAVADALAEVGFTREVLDWLIDKSQNMFLYLRIVCKDIINGQYSLRDIDELPYGIESIFAQYFNRQYSGERQLFFRQTLRPLLETGSACRAGITLELLQESAVANGIDLSHQEVTDALHTLGSLAEIQPGDHGGREFRFIHKLIWEWLTSLPEGIEYRIEKLAGHKMLVNFSLKKICTAADINDSNYSYALRYVVSHLIALNDSAGLWNILSGVSPSIFEKQKKHFGDYAVCLDDCAQAIAFFSRAINNPPGASALPQVCRLMITYRSLLEKQKGSLQELLTPELDLKYALKVMRQIDDAKTYFLIGCWLLAHSAKQNADIEPLIVDMEQKCSGRLSSIRTSIGEDPDELVLSPEELLAERPGLYGQEYYFGFRNTRVIPFDTDAVSYINLSDSYNYKNYDQVLNVYECLFLGFGPLNEAMFYLTVDQLERVVSIVGENEAREIILDGMSARSCQANVAGAMWHFEKLHHYAGTQIEPPGAEDTWELESKEYLNFINILLVHNICSREGYTADLILKEIVDLYNESYETRDTFFIFKTTELLYQLGEPGKALDFLLAYSGDIVRHPLALATELCKYGEYEKALSIFENHVFPPAKSIHSVIRSEVSVFKLISAILEADLYDNLWKITRNVPDILRNLTIPEIGNLLADIISREQYTLAAEIFEIVFADEIITPQKSGKWCRKILDAPDIIDSLKSLAEADQLPRSLHSMSEEKLQSLWSGEIFIQWIQGLKSYHQISLEDELLKKVFNSTDLESISNQVLKPGIPVEIQLFYIDRIFYLFTQRASTLQKDEMLQEIKEILCILGKNSGELRGDLGPYTEELLLRYISGLDPVSIAELEFFKPAAPNALQGPFENMLLFDSLDEDVLNKCMFSLTAYTQNKVYCFIVKGLIREIKDLFDHTGTENSDRAVMIFESVKALLEYHAARKNNAPDYEWQVPDFIVEVIKLAQEYGGRFSPELPRLLYTFRDQNNAGNAAAVLMDMRKNEIAQFPGVPLLWEAFLCDYSWLLSWPQYCEIAARKLKTGYKYGNLNTFISRLEKVDIYPDDWIGSALEMLEDPKCLPDITLPGNRDEVDLLRYRLSKLIIAKAAGEQVKKVLLRLNMNANVLVKCASQLPSWDPMELYNTLNNDLEWGKNNVYRLIAMQEWWTLPFDELCTISSCMLNDNTFFKVWLNAMLDKLYDPACTEMVPTIVENCPELDYTQGKIE